MPQRVKILTSLTLMICSFGIGGNRLVHAQKVFFAEKLDSLGKPINQRMEYAIDLIRGSKIVFIYEGKQIIPLPKAYFFVDRKSEKDIFKEFDNQKVSITDSTQKKVNYSYLFTREGFYKISFANAEKKVLASAFISIKFNSNIIFSEKINEEELPENYASQFILKPNLEIYSYLKLSKPINCNSITHQIYRYDGKNYSQQVFSGRFMVNKMWNYTYLKFIYNTKGKYKVIIKSDLGNILGVNYLKVE